MLHILLYSSSCQVVILVEDIVDKCVIMNLAEQMGLMFISQFPNYAELD